MQVVPLSKCHLVLPKTYPSWTLVGQAMGSVRLAYEGLQLAVPQVAFQWTFSDLLSCRKLALHAEDMTRLTMY